MNGVRKARKIAGLTREGAAAIIGVTAVTWDKKENDPLKFSIGEFFTLYRELDTDAQDTLWNYLEGMKDGIQASKYFFTKSA